MLEKQRPALFEDINPLELISKGDVMMLSRHYKAFESGQIDRFPDNERDYVVFLYGILRDHGFFVRGVDASGTLLFGVALKSDTQLKLEFEN